MSGEKGEKSSLGKKTLFLLCFRMPSFDWNNFLKKKLSFLSGNCQPTEMGQREKGESESEVEVTASWQVRIFFVKFCKVFEKIIASLMGVTEFVLSYVFLQYWENLPYNFHSLVNWEGIVRFISHTTTAHHEKFKQLLMKIINGNLFRLVRYFLVLQRKKKIVINFNQGKARKAISC